MGKINIKYYIGLSMKLLLVFRHLKDKPGSINVAFLPKKYDYLRVFNIV